MQSKILVSNVWVEDLFTWFYSHIISSGGDGSGQIICENFIEVADWFLEWESQNASSNSLNSLLKKGVYKRFQDHNYIIISDGNENFVFTNSLDNLHENGDYNFIVNGDCPSILYGRRVIKAI